MTHTGLAIFAWDEAKSDTCFAARGFDLTYAASAFFDPHRLILAATRHNARVDATTAADIARQAATDEAQAMQHAAKFARRVRKRLGMRQL